MPRKSYAEHRAQRAASVALSDDTGDLDSLASYSTYASHTTLGSAAYPHFGSFSTSASASGYASPYYGVNNYGHGLGLAPPPQLRSRTFSNVSVHSRGSARGSQFRDASSSPSLPASPRLPRRPSSNFSPAPPSVRGVSAGASAPGSGLNTKSGTPEDSHTHTPTDRDREKRKKRARNEERWRRVRAREAAHDAPVRRLAKYAHARWGSVGAVVAAVLAALAVRVILGIVVLCISGHARRALGREADSVWRSCSGRHMKLLTPFCRLTFPNQRWTMRIDDDTWPGMRAATGLFLGRLIMEVPLWSAAVAWSTLEGWREGRTLRTRVAAIIYLGLGPALVLSDTMLLPVRAALGLSAWAIVAVCSGGDAAAAALVAASVCAERSTMAYVPGFVIYFVGKRVWLGEKGAGYIGRLIVCAALSCTAIAVLGPIPLRTIVARLNPINFAQYISPIRTLLVILSLAACAPSAYLVLKASRALRPSSTDTAAPSSVPATARLLPLALAATSGAFALWDFDVALPLLPVAFASALRRDDDEWAVAVQVQHIASIAMWSKGDGVTTALSAAYVLAWSWLIGARLDAPNLALRIHQFTTYGLSIVSLLAPLLERLPFRIPYAHAVLVAASLLTLIVWANVRLVKTAWAAGAL